MCGGKEYRRLSTANTVRVNGALTGSPAQWAATENTTMRIAFLTFTALAALGLAAGHVATADTALVLTHLARIFG